MPRQSPIQRMHPPTIFSQSNPLVLAHGRPYPGNIPPPASLECCTWKCASPSASNCRPCVRIDGTNMTTGTGSCGLPAPPRAGEPHRARYCHALGGRQASGSGFLPMVCQHSHAAGLANEGLPSIGSSSSWGVATYPWVPGTSTT